MNTLLNIALGFLLFIFVSVSVVLISGWLILQFLGIKEEECGCSSCDCDDKPKINDFSKKTKITGMGGVGGPIDSVRGKNKNEPREENDPNPTQK